MPKVGEILDKKYRIIRHIGKGGMGSVFEAEHEELSKRVAIKIPKDDLADSPKELERFKREPRVAAATGHKGIIDVYDIGTISEGVPYVVMEYLDGETLATRLKKEGRCEPELVSYVIAQVLSALAAAHEKGIIHRDLKPDNIFLVKAGHDLPEVKILDFGTSKFVAGSQADHKLTESGTILGTPYYMAPEQFVDERNIDHRLDIYSVGVMAYEALTGKLPIDAENVYALVHKVLNDDIEPPRALFADIPAELEEIVLRALAREREERYGSAASMLQALLPLLSSEASARVPLPDILRSSKAPQLEDNNPRDAVSVHATTVRDTSTPLEVGDLSTTKRNRSGRSSSRPLLAGGGAVLALVAGVFLWSSWSDEPASPSANDAVALASQPVDASLAPNTDGAVSLSSSSSANDGGAARDELALDPDDDLITITLDNVPDGAVVTLDGARASKLPLRLPRSRGSRTLRVVQGDEELLAELITLNDDQRFVVGGSRNEEGYDTEESEETSPRPAGNRRPLKRTPMESASSAAPSQPANDGPATPPQKQPTKRSLDFVNTWRPSGSE